MIDPSFLAAQVLTGLSSAAILFVIASGLSLVFGVTKIVNFAHGSFYMAGAYLAATLCSRLSEAAPLIWKASPLPFFTIALLCAVLVGGIGVVVEALVLRRLYGKPDLLQLLATYGLVLMAEDAMVMLFGPQEVTAPRPVAFRGAVMLFGQPFPVYDLVLAVIGPLVLLLLLILLKRTRFGVLVRAAAHDREMLGLLGVNHKLLFSITLFIGAGLAGFGGALQTPRIAAHAGMDLAIIAECFVVTVVGGMGSLTGAFFAAILIGLLQALGILVFPKITVALVFIVMALVLLVRPQGLNGKVEPPGNAEKAATIAVSLSVPRPLWPVFVLVVLLALLPLIVDAHTLTLLTEVFIVAIFVASLQFLVANGGIVSFGHAAFFGLGAYGAAIIALQYGWPMPLALLAAIVVAAMGAGLIGLLLERLSGIYLAMMTLAAAQILYAGAVEWTALTGGDNGLVGIWPPPWAENRIVFYELALAIAVLALTALIFIANTPFGYSLRALRDAPMRAEASGLRGNRQRWLAFVISGGFAGLAGGLYAFAKGTVGPSALGIQQSVDALAMMLLGGIGSVLGAPVGAAAFVFLSEWLKPLTDWWRFLFGLSLLLIVLAAPDGLPRTLLSEIKSRIASLRRIPA